MLRPVLRTANCRASLARGNACATVISVDGTTYGVVPSCSPLALRQPLAYVAVRPIAAVWPLLLVAGAELGEAVGGQFGLLLHRILVQAGIVAA